ncbi:hypothetical protein GE061_004128 [Apolygus lucorum]|uniref:Uncharacterized protein n=1 Tax=Apolygus lucorum TaxID=248454 RepID=A0A8S9WYH7_APOLU|nr:hypothetical protein GE061_004128 [Apolygus lucorum]
MGSQKSGLSITPIRMFLLLFITILENIISNEGQPMSSHCMNVYPIEGILHGMLPHSFLHCPPVAQCPLVYSPQTPIPCEVEQNFLEPHTFEDWKSGKWKMAKPLIPWRPCVVGIRPQQVFGPRFQNCIVDKNLCIEKDVIKNHTLSDSTISSLSSNSVNGTTLKLNVTDEIKFHNASRTNKGDKMDTQITNLNNTTPVATHKSQVGDGGYSKVSVLTDDGNGWISSLCQSPMVLYERYVQPNKTNCDMKLTDANLTKPEVNNTTNSSIMLTECESPSLLTLDCLACMLSKNAENNTINGTTLVKKLNGTLDEVEHLAVAARILTNSSGSQIPSELTKQQMVAMEDCLADGNKSEPYLINGRPIIVKLQNQTNKHFLITKKTGHDFLIALPQEVDQDENTTPTAVVDNVQSEPEVTTEKVKDYRDIFDLNDIPDQSGPPSGLELALIEAERNHVKGLVTPRATTQQTRKPQEFIHEESTIPVDQDYFDLYDENGNKGVANSDLSYSCSSDNPDREMAPLPLASCLFRIPNYTPQPAFLTPEMQIQRAMTGTNGNSFHQCTYSQTLRPCPAVYVLNTATKPSDLSNEPLYDRRKLGVKYEKCRRKSSQTENKKRAPPTRNNIVEQRDGDDSNQNGHLSWQTEEQIAEPNVDFCWADEDPNRSQSVDRGAPSWPRNCDTEDWIHNIGPFQIVIQPQEESPQAIC